jgi:hypothetical protein
MSEGKLSKFGHSSKVKRTAKACTSATSLRTTANRRYKTSSTQTRSDSAVGDVTLNTFAHPNVSKTELYEALYGLNAGIQQFLNSLTFLDKAGLGLPFLNGYRILADEIRSAINFSTAETMTAIELRDYKELEKERTKFSFAPIETLTSESKNCK